MGIREELGVVGFLHELLQRGDMQGDATFSSEELDGLSGEDVSLLVGMGVVRQPTAETRGRWLLDRDGLAAWLTRSLGVKWGTGAIVPGRMWFIGLLRHRGRMRDVFLARGLLWPDGRTVVDGSERLLASACPVVLVYSEMPRVGFWQHCWPAVGSLRELGYVHGCQLLVDWDVLVTLPSVPPVPRTGSGDVIPQPNPRDEIVLTHSELHILRAMADEPRRPFLLVEVMSDGGYSKLTTRKSLSRLRQLGLVAKPPGTQRKGDAVTTKGLAFLDGQGLQRGKPSLFG